MTINMALIGLEVWERHANGYLEQNIFSDLNIVAVCDIHESVAGRLLIIYIILKIRQM